MIASSVRSAYVAKIVVLLFLLNLLAIGGITSIVSNRASQAPGAYCIADPTNPLGDRRSNSTNPTPYVRKDVPLN